ncbi:MAG TPA: hypothetical protein VEU33_04205, partial [Archangium sp.]|nr:hypothetical protein [Archangium sp.]
MSAPVHSPSPELPLPLPGMGALHPFDMPPLPVGTSIGGDVVEAVLGRGGFAIVYRVRSPEGYVSAVKMLPLDLGPERT